jgi:hypothetical protein
MFCTGCGKQNSDDANFCKHCGTRLWRGPASPIGVPAKPQRWTTTGRNLAVILVAVLVLITGLMILRWSRSDREPPTSPAILVKVTPSNDSTPTFSWSASSDTGSGVTRYLVSLDDEDWADIGNLTTYTSGWVTDGHHTFDVMAVDKAGNKSESTRLEFLCDTKPPVISGITVSNQTATTARIDWVTSEVSTSQVSYGIGVSYTGNTAPNTILATLHSVTITGLSSATTYHYCVKSTDASGNQRASGDQTFETPWVGPNGETLTEVVTYGGGVVVGADGHEITLENNPEARNVTWAELQQFLLSDQTNTLLYNYSTFVCADFAERLHNNAEKAGIRAAYVCIHLMPECVYDPYTGCSYCHPLGIGHACNAFMTTDRGLVFVDDTGQTDGSGEDRTVSIASGQLYVGWSIFTSTTWCPMGTVEEFGITW